MIDSGASSTLRPHVFRLLLPAAIALFFAASRADATLSFQNTYFGYTNNASATINTSVSTSNAFYLGLYGNNHPNLFANGGFEFGATSPNQGAAGTNWAAVNNLTDLMSYWTAGRPAANTTLIQGWTAGGSTNSSTNDLAGGAYGIWGHQGTTVADSAPIVQGSNAVYFGDSVANTPQGGSTTGTPTYATNGKVTWNGTFNVVPGAFGSGGVHQAVQLSQTVTGLILGHQYIFSFWASGEDASGAKTREGGDGVFGLTVSGETDQLVNAADGIHVTQLLAAPYSTADTTFNSARTAGFGGSHYYQYIYIPTSTTATFTFTNWGHIQFDATAGATHRASELVLDDVVLFDAGLATPEPSTYALAGVGLAAIIFLSRRNYRIVH